MNDKCKKKRVLVIDDDRVVRDFLKRLVNLRGIEAFEAQDGYKAIEMTKNEVFDFYFLDVRMPGIDGLETFRQIRKMHPSARIVMITGYAVEDILGQVEEEGSLGIIRKPFNIIELQGVIDDINAEHKGRSLSSVLVIDDDESIIDFFKGLLKDKNINYSFAGNKNEALKIVRENKFDLIFLDLVFENESGLEIYEGIKAIYPNANIVLMSGYHQKIKEVEGEIELFGCLYKPFELKNVLGYIDRINE